jgi:type II restriction/modification system DNA methylase subunit YeeA
MNKAKLKSYAPKARQDFIAAVTARANLLGLSAKSGQLEVTPAQTQGDVTVIAGQAWPAKVNGQRERLIDRMKRDGFEQTCESIAYTWFNRFAALRYMELHDYLGHGHRALSSVSGELPDILTYAADLTNAGESGLPGLKAEVVTEMKLAGDRDGELYRMLLVAQCNALSRAMPFLFERIDDDSELLLPDNLLRSDSVIAKLVEEIPEEDWAEVEIIGWLYQFYISEKKDQVIGKVVKSEDIPAATQLFTPNWIVQYLVQNSVGHLWLMANPQSTLAKEWPYYITPAEQTPEVQAHLDALIQTRVREDGDTLSPESITVLDPACGSGHILVVAYDVLKAIYLERGYQLRAIPRLILEKNLYGLDIDDRAAQMACFALLMKARADDRRLFSTTDDEGNLQTPMLNVLALQSSEGMNVQALSQALQAHRKSIKGGNSIGVDFVRNDLFPDSHRQMTLSESISSSTTREGQPYTTNPGIESTIAALIETFVHAKTFGSLIQIGQNLSLNVLELLSIIKQAQQSDDLYAQAAARDLLPLIQQVQVLAMRFDAVVANPPYMGSKYHVPLIKDFLKTHFKGFEKDLFAAFALRNSRFSKPGGKVAVMSSNVWMFISSYEEMRVWLLEKNTLNSLVQLSNSGFDGATVFVCAFVFSTFHIPNILSSFVRLVEFSRPSDQAPKTVEAIQNSKCNWFYRSKPDDFKKIPGSPIGYWVSEQFKAAFTNGVLLKDIADPKKGLATTDNNRFLRYWFEVESNKLGVNFKSRDLAAVSGKKWFPLNKGGEFRRWYGNCEYVINWENDGYELKNAVITRYGGGSYTKEIRNEDKYFKDGITWSALTSSNTSFRYSDNGALFDSAGSTMNPKGRSEEVIALLNTPVVNRILLTLNPTLNYGAGTIANIPVIFPINIEKVREIASQLINISKNDWNSHELSWDFASLSWLKSAPKVETSWNHWETKCKYQIRLTNELETENNGIFIDAYGLQDELSPVVPESQITLARADREKDSQLLISYAIGCMMGRYSLDEPGLIYARSGNVGFEAGRYTTFTADADGIVPITDELWYEDDAVLRIREFLLAVWGEDTLDANLAWLAESLGSKATETPDETIRRYVADKFFKDHLQTYKKRPIYWLFSSGRQGAFQALVYLHRYHEGTLSRMRAEYVVPLTSKIQSRIEMLQKDMASASSTVARNKLAKEVEKLKKKHVELLAYDEQLRHYADMRIKLDLDDGVKVNYGKFGDLLAEVKAVTGGASDD